MGNIQFKRNCVKPIKGLGVISVKSLSVWKLLNYVTLKKSHIPSAECRFWALGFFDGVQGHKKLINQAKKFSLKNTVN